MSSKKIRQQFADTMLEVGQKDPRLVVLLGDISHFIMQPFAKACPGRFYNVGICEPTIVSMGAGLAKTGLVPVIHTIAPFIIERSFEQLKLDFCYQRLSGNLITVGSVFDYSNLGCTHHCYDDFTLLRSLPNTQVIYPASCEEFDLLFRETYDNSKLTLFRLPETHHGQAIEASLIRFGKAVTMTEGKDLTIVVTGPQLGNVMEAVRLLSDEGWDIEVLYMHTVHPFDLEAVRASVQKTGRLFTVEEHNRFGGLGHDILRGIHDIKGVEFHSLGIDSFIHEYGPYEHLCGLTGLSTEGILGAVRERFRREYLI